MQDTSPAVQTAPVYDGFISYRHKPDDTFVASTLQKMLEHYRVPKKIQQLSGKKRINRIFRDKEELTITDDLEADITEALKSAEFLIVICSPEAAESEWVNKEILTFLEYHDRSKVMAVMISGEAKDSLPPALMREEKRQIYENGEMKEITRLIEPLYVNAKGRTNAERKKNLKADFLRLAAPMLHCSYDDLKQRHREYETRRRLAIAAGAAALSAAFGIYAWVKARQINEQYQAALINQSRYLSEVSSDMLSQGDRIGAIATALSALPSEDNDRPVVPEAAYALNEALYVYKYDFSGVYVYPDNDLMMDHTIASILDHTEGEKVMCLDSAGVIGIFDISIEPQKPLRILPGDIGIKGRAFYGGRFFSDGDLLLLTDSVIARYDPNAGKAVWQTDLPNLHGIDTGENNYALAPDESRLVFYNNGFPKELEIFDMADGAMLYARAVPFEFADSSFCDCLDMAFSEDSALLAACFEGLVNVDTEGVILPKNTYKSNLFFMDMTSGEITLAAADKDPMDTRRIASIGGRKFATLAAKAESCFGVNKAGVESYFLISYDGKSGKLLYKKEKYGYTAYSEPMEISHEIYELGENTFDTVCCTVNEKVFMSDVKDGVTLFEYNFGAPVVGLTNYSHWSFTAVLGDGLVYSWTPGYDDTRRYTSLTGTFSDGYMDTDEDAVVLLPMGKKYLSVLRMQVDETYKYAVWPGLQFNTDSDFNHTFLNSDMGVFTVIRTGADHDGANSIELLTPDDQPLMKVTGSGETFWDFAIEPDGSVFYYLFESGEGVILRAADLATGAVRYELSLPVQGAILSTDIRNFTLIAADMTGFVAVDLREGSAGGHIPYPEGLANVYRDNALSGNGRYAFFDTVRMSDLTGCLSVYDIQEGSWLALPEEMTDLSETLTFGFNFEGLEKRGYSRHENIAVSHAGDLFALHADDGLVIADITEKKVLWELPFSCTKQCAFDFSGDDRYLVAWGDAGTVTVWDVKKGVAVFIGDEIYSDVERFITDEEPGYIGMRRSVFIDHQWIRYDVTVFSFRDGSLSRYADAGDCVISFKGHKLISMGSTYGTAPNGRGSAMLYEFFPEDALSELIARAKTLLSTRQSKEDMERYWGIR
ncbi:MAG: TIR domain-containing protein [Eubacteriaceae bacterium]|nr:TIR domain-containing protein [Eubacteriaceae bacterium]